MKELLTGNEAVARGAYEGGVVVAAAYPGTPSTEILENFARYPGVYAEWAPNEKVALEVAIGASLAGVRAMAVMKHVGLNVAADPLLTLAYTGVNGGLVVVSADDPGIHSSQNEQDNRHYARFARIPLFEPADSSEAKEMVVLALELSEQYDTPVLLRTTTRVSHSQSPVEGGVASPAPARRPYRKDTAKFLMVPAYARGRRAAIEARTAKLKEYAEKTPLNFIEWRNRSLGVVASGVAYHYVREALPQASVLKLGMTYPLPEELIRRFAAGVERLAVVEELDPFLEEQIKALGIVVAGKEIIPPFGELDPGIVGRSFAKKGFLAAVVFEGVNTTGLPAAPARPPVMCPGCPHRGVLYTLKKLRLTVTGDIGCYTLGGLPPLEAMDFCVCMGASIGASHGISKADPQMAERTVAVIGDSTFLHSGITGLLNCVYNGGHTTVIILDNRTTAMTGHQHHPGTGRTLMGTEAPAVDLEALVRALGVKRVRTVDPLDLAAVESAVREEVLAGEPSVIISRRSCVLLEKKAGQPVVVRSEKCTGCRACTRLGCPSLAVAGGVAAVDPYTCTGCGLCVQVCREGALAKEVLTGV